MIGRLPNRCKEAGLKESYIMLDHRLGFFRVSWLDKAISGKLDHLEIYFGVNQARPRSADVYNLHPGGTLRLACCRERRHFDQAGIVQRGSHGHFE